MKLREAFPSGVVERHEAMRRTDASTPMTVQQTPIGTWMGHDDRSELGWVMTIDRNSAPHEGILYLDNVCNTGLSKKKGTKKKKTYCFNFSRSAGCNELNPVAFSFNDFCSA
jgi:hypothetical protein